MSTQIKFIIPLIDSSLTREDISKETGFVDAFIFDQNRPSLERCCFLMYDAKVRTLESMKRSMKLRSLPSLRSVRHITSNKRAYIVYAFQFFDFSSRLIFKGCIPKQEQARRVLQFWGLDEKDVTKWILDGSGHTFQKDITSVPEEDYAPTIEDFREYRRKKRVVVTK